MHGRTERNFSQRYRVTRTNVRARPGGYRIPDREALRMKDVALLPIAVFDERDTRRAIGIVLDLAHHSGNPVLVALEIDHAVLPLVPPAAPTHRDVTVVVTAPRLLQRFGERLLRRGTRDLREIGDRAKT